MNRFLTPSRLWPAGETRLHVYLLPDLDVDVGLAALVDRCQAVMTEAPFVTAVPDEWLHATVQAVTGRPASQIGAGARHGLVQALTTALAGVPPCTLTVGSVLATASGVLADMDGGLPGGAFHEIYRSCREVIAEIFGDDAIASDTLPPHLTIGYGVGPGDSGVLQTALRRQVRPSHATMTVRQVHLVDVAQDADRSQYRWTPVAVIPLGAESGPAPGRENPASATSTIEEHVAVLTARNRGPWRAAVIRAAKLLTPTWKPDQGSVLATAALMVYAISHDRQVPAANVTPDDLLAWLPDTTSVTELELFSKPLLERGLRAAGHDLPESTPRNVARLSTDPVVAQWQHLTNWSDHYRPDHEESVADEPGPDLIWRMISLRGILNRQPS